MESRELGAMINALIQTYISLKTEEATEKEGATTEQVSNDLWKAMTEVGTVIDFTVANFFVYLDRQKILKRESVMKMLAQHEKHVRKMLAASQEHIDAEGRIQVAQSIPDELKNRSEGKPN